MVYTYVHFIQHCQWDNLSDTSNQIFFIVEGAENAYYVDDGCRSENSTPDDYVGFYQSEYSEAYVRCCSENGNSCTTVNNCNNAANLMNYDDAQAECVERGMRLCTMDELLTDI